MNLLLRREFIKSLGLAITGVFVAALPHKLLAGKENRLTCSYCGAHVVRWHSYGTGNKKGMFCPNCSIEVRKGSFTLQSSSRNLFFKTRKKQPARQKWECALVPFPNPDLVVQTGKPKMKLADLKF